MSRSRRAAFKGLTDEIAEGVKFAILTCRNRHNVEADDVACAAKRDYPRLRCIHDLSTLDITRIMFHLGYRITSTKSYYHRYISHLPKTFWRKNSLRIPRAPGGALNFTPEELSDYRREFYHVLRDMGDGECGRDEIVNMVQAHPEVYPNLKWIGRTGMISVIRRLGCQTKRAFGDVVVLGKKCRDIGSSDIRPKTKNQEMILKIIQDTGSPYHIDLFYLKERIKEKYWQFPAPDELDFLLKNLRGALTHIGYKRIQRDMYFKGGMQHLPKNILKLRPQITRTRSGKSSYCTGELEDSKKELKRAISKITGDIITRRKICDLVWSDRDRYPVLWWTSEIKMARLIYRSGYAWKRFKDKKRKSDIAILLDSTSSPISNTPVSINPTPAERRKNKKIRVSTNENIKAALDRIRGAAIARQKLGKIKKQHHRGIYRSPSF